MYGISEQCPNASNHSDIDSKSNPDTIVTSSVTDHVVGSVEWIEIIIINNMVVNVKISPYFDIEKFVFSSANSTQI